MKLLGSWSIFKPPSPQRMVTFLDFYKYKDKDIVDKDTKTLNGYQYVKNTAKKLWDVKLWSERDERLDKSKGIIYYLHSFRHNKGHVSFAKGLLERQSLFGQFTIHFSGYNFKNNEARETWTETKKYLDKGNISYTRVVHDSKFAYEEHLCHPSGKAVVTWSDADANPRIPYDGLFCNLPHFSSYESNLNPNLASVGAFHRYEKDGFPADKLHRFLLFRWNDAPIRFALANVTYENMFCQLINTYNATLKCCDRS
jgi:hypothetical protein